MITPSFSLTATERVLPKLALDFTTASLDSRVTFTRTGNTATVTNSSGYVVPINADLPRFDYDPITLVCKGLLIEEARTNLVLDSSAYSTANWIRNRSTTAASAVVSPDGVNTALFIAEDTTFGAHGVSINPALTVTIGQTYTMSVFAKAGTNGWIIVNFFDTSAVQTYFNVTTGTIGTIGSGCTASIQSYGNGWYRCSVTKTMTTTSLNYQILTTRSNGLYTYAGSVTQGNYFWGSQLELGAFATSYIPTTTTSLTRNADVATMTGTNFSSWYNAVEGTFVLQSQTPLNATYAEYLAASSGAYANCITLGYQSSAGQLLGQMYSGGASILYNNPQGAGAGAVNKQAITYKSGNSIYATNGGVRQTSTSASIPTGVDRLNIGRTASGGSSANGYVQKIFFYTNNFTAAEMQAFTK